MSRAKLIDYYIEKSREEDFEIDQIRKELEPKGVDEEEIRIIVRLVDNEIQKRDLLGSDSKKANELVSVGLVLTILGAAVTIGTYTGIINTGESFLLAYGPFFGGISVLLTGLAKSKKTPSKFKQKNK